MEAEISTQNLALLSQNSYKVFKCLPIFKCSLTSPRELDHCLVPIQLIPQWDLKREMNITGNKL